MRILILGGDGMLGHRLLRSLGPRHEVAVTLHREQEIGDPPATPHAAAVHYGVDVRRPEQVEEILDAFRPEAVLNAVGIVKQRSEAKQVVPSLEVNALFPHRLARMCEGAGARVVHVSTDCVFSGRRGGYVENDPSDAEDIYGRTKYLGELHEPHCVTLRSSIIGLELQRRTGLVEWFLAQEGPIRGFRRAIYSGLTTREMSRLIERVLIDHPDLSGLWHVASEPITKYDLLAALARRLERDVRIDPDDELVCDRSLNGEAFTRATDYGAPSWGQMLDELAVEIRAGEKGP